MKYNFNIPLGVPISGTPKKQIGIPAAIVLGSLGGAAMSGGLGFFGQSSQNKATKEQMQLQHEYNLEEMEYSQQLNKQYQNYL